MRRLVKSYRKMSVPKTPFQTVFMKCRSKDMVCLQIKKESPLLEAVELLLKHGMSSLPVLDSRGRPAGILTKADILQLLEKISSEHSQADYLRVKNKLFLIKFFLSFRIKNCNRFMQ